MDSYGLTLEKIINNFIPAILYTGVSLIIFSIIYFGIIFISENIKERIKR